MTVFWFPNRVITLIASVPGDAAVEQERFRLFLGNAPGRSDR
jgi:hypothetical protein